jgi:hypothetical protein
MRSITGNLAATAFRSGVALLTALLVASLGALAQGSDAGRPLAAEALASPSTSHTPRFSESDRAAALESVQFALSELGDGASFVWHRGNGRLSGVVQPTKSFLDADGRVCRHVIVLLSAADRSRQTEAVACRLENGIWRFDG